jgi:small subunit ribosomal protein S16
VALKIRLSRGGAKKRPFYSIVVTDSRNPRDGRFIEKIGTFNPLLPKDHDARIVLKRDRAEHWIKTGAKPTDRVARFLSQENLWDWKPSNNPQKAKPGAKAQERLKEQEEKAEAAKAAEAEAAAAAESVEAPAEAEAEAETPAEAPAEDGGEEKSEG